MQGKECRGEEGPEGRGKNLRKSLKGKHFNRQKKGPAETNTIVLWVGEQFSPYGIQLEEDVRRLKTKKEGGWKET